MSAKQSSKKNSPKELKPASNDPVASTTSEDTHNAIQNRRSKELVIAFCGPIGCGIDGLIDNLSFCLKEEDYVVEHIKVSSLIERFYNDTHPDTPIDSSALSRFERYNRLMEAGTTIRKEFSTTMCVDLAISEIALRRGKEANNPNDDLSAEKEIALKKKAYIIDQLKHPDEVKALKAIYSNIFYLIGALSDSDNRTRNLENREGIQHHEAHKLILRDQKEQNEKENGQNVSSTLFNADFFINNSTPNAEASKKAFLRFLKLIHGGHGVTPTHEEYGMYSAFNASLQSACMSRQVGASIIDEVGNVLAVGKNDVPKFGGGLYGEDDNCSPTSHDYRCVRKDQKCHNDLHKNKLKEQIKEILKTELEEHLTGSNLTEQDVHNISDKIAKNTPIKQLIEYSRAIHAEMDAILAFTRKGTSIPENATIYSTTYPCHNCARHIVATGIKTIVYIEPYEKSLALTLHEDSMTQNNEADKVLIRPFHGVAPHRYKTLFFNSSPKKDGNGHLITTDKADQSHVYTEYVDSYLAREVKVANAILEAKSKQDGDTIETPGPIPL